MAKGIKKLPHLIAYIDVSSTKTLGDLSERVQYLERMHGSKASVEFDIGHISIYEPDEND